MSISGRSVSERMEALRRWRTWWKSHHPGRPPELTSFVTRDRAGRGSPDDPSLAETRERDARAEQSARTCTFEVF